MCQNSSRTPLKERLLVQVARWLTSWDQPNYSRGGVIKGRTRGHITPLCLCGLWLGKHRRKLQALVYDILPSTTAVFSYAIGSRKLSPNEQFFVGAQTVVSLLQTTQIKQGVSFKAANKVYTSTNKTTIVWIEMELFFLPGVDASHVYVRALALACFYSHILVPGPFGGRWPRRWTAARR